MIDHQVLSGETVLFSDFTFLKKSDSNDLHKDLKKDVRGSRKGAIRVSVEWV